MMQKDTVGMLQFSSQVNGEDALIVKLFRDGTVMREGGGGLPPVGVMGQYRSQNIRIFEHLLGLIPQEILEKPIVWQQPDIAFPVDYKVLCYAGNKNNGIGLQADWGAIAGMRVVFDLHNPPPNALVSLADKLIQAARTATTGQYFDFMVEAVYRHHSSTLPDNTLIDVYEDSPEWLSKALGRYVVQMASLSGKYKIEDLPKGKLYSDRQGRRFLLSFSVVDSKVNVRFDPA
jgi:uncharacterized protein (DUF1778 family)